MTPRRRRWLRVWVRVRHALRAIGLVLLVVAVWGSTAYVCGRRALMLTDEGAQRLMRQLLQGIQ